MKLAAFSSPSISPSLTVGAGASLIEPLNCDRRVTPAVVRRADGRTAGAGGGAAKVPFL